MIRPTRRAVAIFLGGVPLSLLLLTFNAQIAALSLLYGVLVLIALAGDALSAFPRRLLQVDLAVPERLYIGERGDIAVTIAPTAHGRPTRFEILAELRGAADPAAPLMTVLEPGQSARIGIPVVPRQRGRLLLATMWLRWQGPLRLVEMTRAVAADQAIEVLPNVRGVQSAALQFYAREAIFGVKVQQQKGEGAEFDSLRDYAAGLDSRFIDWKHSARHRRLLCKEFTIERNHQVVMAFDTGYLMREPIDGIPRLDHAINAGLLLAWISLRGGDLVGVYGFDARIRHYLAPVRGLSGFARIQRAAAALGYHHEETNFTLGLAELGVRLKRRALVIVFTDFVDTVTAELLIESLQRAAARHVVIFVTLRDGLLQRVADAPPERFTDVAEAVIAHDLLRDRSIVLERLARLGIHCLDVPSGGLSAALISRYLMIKERDLI